MYIAIDMGGTNTRIALFKTAGATTFQPIAHFPTHATYDDQVAHLVQIVRGLNNDAVKGIGFAIGAQLTRDGSGVAVSYTMRDYELKPLVTDVSAALNCDVVAANDNVCAVLLERRAGSLQGVDRCAYLTVSTGTGAGIYLGRGDTGVAFFGQVGHHMIDPQGERCVCGQIGCVQTITGGQSIRRRIGVEAKHIESAEFWQTITQTLSIAIVNVARISRLDAICLSGGIGFNSLYLREHLLSQVREAGPNVPVQVTWAAFGEDAPLIGASLLVDGMGTTILH